MTALDTLRAVPKLTAHDIFKVSDNMPADDLAALDAYLAGFASPTNAEGNYACINCNEQFAEWADFVPALTGSRSMSAGRTP